MEFVDWIMIALMGLAVVLLVVALCGLFVVIVGAVQEWLDPMKSGIVIDKWHRPTRTTYALVGKMTVPMIQPASWHIDVEGTTANGKNATRSFSVTRESFERTKVGDKYERDE